MPDEATPEGRGGFGTNSFDRLNCFEPLIS